MLDSQDEDQGSFQMQALMKQELEIRCCSNKIIVNLNRLVLLEERYLIKVRRS